MCEALVDSVISGISSRFSSQLEDLELILASAFHPKFKLSWCRGDDLNSKRIVDEITILVNKKLFIEKDLSNSSIGSEDNHETFFINLRTPSNTDEGVQLINNYLDGPLSTTLPCPSACKPLVEPIILYNTPILLSAAVERMFSLGKDILKPKRSSLSDDHFEMLVFLKEK